MSKVSLRIKDWSHFQHFKDRRPPWIKIYRELLEDPDWHELDGETAKHLVMLWLLASEDKTMQGFLPNSVKKIAFRLRISEAKAKQLLNKLSNWLIQDDITMISDQYQTDIPKSQKNIPETETETETETDTISNTISPPSRKKGFSPPTIADVEAYVQEKGYKVDPARFCSYYGSIGWVVGKKPMKSWKCAVAGWSTRDSSNGSGSGISAQKEGWV